MKGKNTTEQRKQRIELTHGMLLKLVPIEYTKAMSVVAFNHGVTKEKAREYIGILKDTGAINVREGMIYPPETKG